jgi:hypothetical protein
MADNDNARPSREVYPSKTCAGHYESLIRQRGKLAERSDRAYVSEEKARENGEAVIQRLLHPVGERR